MGLFGRKGPGTRPGAGASARREESRQAWRHLEEFTRTRPGVEAYVEPATSVLPPTVLLVAATGEWTRRRVPDPAAVRQLGVPVYDARLVGYPRRMREWNEQAKRGPGPSPGTPG